MNALTKTFVVLLVVVSLLSAAGFIVFVNQVQNFKVALVDYKGQLDQSKAAVAAANSQASMLQAQVNTATRELQEARQKTAEVQAANATTVAGLNATIAADRSQASIAEITANNITAALKASEDQRTALNTALAASRAESDTANGKYLGDEIRINELTQSSDVLKRQVTDLTEQVAQSKSENDRLMTLIKEHPGIDPNSTAVVTTSAPPINAVVRQTGETNGIPYATISVGSAEQVTKGMVFQVIDRSAGKYLGELTINAVDLHQATGKLEGPGISDVRAGTTEVRTQL